MSSKPNQKVALITGSAGFIGFHVSQKLLQQGWQVIGIDSMSDYYDVSLKQAREQILIKEPSYISIHSRIDDPGVLLEIFQKKQPDIVVHLAAQAGVRYSLENPRSYAESNILGTFELLEAVKVHRPLHLLMASTSSVYGANINMPFKEEDKADMQLSFYAATKKATENMAHSYAYLFDIPTTVFRFFTVYGPWGRPDMALFKFTKALLKNEAIDIYNYGNQSRDFTFIDDIVNAIISLITKIPSGRTASDSKIDLGIKDRPVAPFRVINLGNSKPIKLMDFITELEKNLGIKAKKNFMPKQSGDVTSTWADTSLLSNIVGNYTRTDLSTGVNKFLKWYREYYKI